MQAVSFYCLLFSFSFPNLSLCVLYTPNYPAARRRCYARAYDKQPIDYAGKENPAAAHCTLYPLQFPTLSKEQ